MRGQHMQKSNILVSELKIVNAMRIRILGVVIAWEQNIPFLNMQNV